MVAQPGGGSQSGGRLVEFARLGTDTHTALGSLLDDFGHEEAEVHRIIREVLEQLPDEHSIRAIQLG